jgi:hypothetical protein
MPDTDFTQISARYLAAWNETDPAARVTALAELCTPGVRYTDPLAEVTGTHALSELIGAVQSQFAGFGFTAYGPVDGHHQQVRFRWELGPEGGDAPVAGFDVAELADDGRISRVLGFLDRVPAAS